VRRPRVREGPPAHVTDRGRRGPEIAAAVPPAGRATRGEGGTQAGRGADDAAEPRPGPAPST
jgi:hypothetical protein